MLPYLDLLKLGGIGAVIAGIIALFLRWLHVEKKNAIQSVIIKQKEANEKGVQDYYQSLEKSLEKSDEINRHQKAALQTLDPNDPRWNDILYKGAADELLDPIHTDPTEHAQSPRKKS